MASSTPTTTVCRVRHGRMTQPDAVIVGDSRQPTGEV
jgi:hypothetical protein